MQKTRTTRRFAPTLLLTLILGACGGGGGGGDGGNNNPQTPAGPTATATALTAVNHEAAGANCGDGGNKIDTGLDANDNGTLDSGEVTSTRYLCNDMSMNWVAVDGDVEAKANTGYIASSDTAQVKVSLPANPAIGEVVRVAGAGKGGWKIAQHDGQQIKLDVMAGDTWTAHAVPGPDGATRPWYRVTSSSDGAHLAALENDLEDGGQIYTSADGGLTWTAHSTDPDDPTVKRPWTSIASSGDGSTLVASATGAGGQSGGKIYISTDGGANWTSHSTDPTDPDKTGMWSAVAISQDGQTMVAAEYGGQIHVSTNGGQAWQAATGAPAGVQWWTVAISGDGSKFLAGGPDGSLYMSTASDLTLVSVGPAGLDANWFSVAMSSDGSKLVAPDYGGQIYISDDGGANWTAQESNRTWLGITSSADGRNLTATDQGSAGERGRIYTSSDGGVNWTAHQSFRSWQGLASSADGSRLTAVEYGGQIYTSTSATMVGTGGSVSGAAVDAIELVYVGNGVFQALSHQGNPTAQ